MADDEYDLIIAAQGGDQAAFDALVHSHQAWVRGFISRYVNNPEDVFDVAQEVFIEVYRSLKRYDPQRSLNAWLRGVAYNRVKFYFRTEQRRRNRERVAMDERMFAWQDEMPADASEGDQLAALRDCVDRLEEKNQALVKQRYFSGIDLRQLAETTGKTSSALAMIFMRIRTALARCIQSRLEMAE